MMSKIMKIEIPLFSSQPLITNDDNLSTSITAIEKRFAGDLIYHLFLFH